MAKVVAYVPARMESSRYPGKPLAPILGMPMVIHCLKRVQLCREVSSVVVATCNPEIMAAVEQHGGQAVMTASTHVRCTDRIIEASEILGLPTDIVVLVQGDEPMIRPEMIELAVRPLLDDPRIQCTNLVAPITSEEEFRSPNSIKVVLDENQDILYMSREPIPTDRISTDSSRHRLKQVCVMGFRPAVLEKFKGLPPSLLEVLESIDMNRLLANRIPVRAVLCETETFAVDTPADLQRVEKLMAADPIVKSYLP